MATKTPRKRKNWTAAEVDRLKDIMAGAEKAADGFIVAAEEFKRPVGHISQKWYSLSGTARKKARTTTKKPIAASTPLIDLAALSNADLTVLATSLRDEVNARSKLISAAEDIFAYDNQ